MLQALGEFGKSGGLGKAEIGFDWVCFAYKGGRMVDRIGPPRLGGLAAWARLRVCFA